ncbi:hypothetical protein HDV06_004430 [Boothiomyces sp. JEL0866]|nr:hypothetical protein HDV06_004430 [Boothiomyces sp. JEL0866]
MLLLVSALISSIYAQACGIVPRCPTGTVCARVSFDGTMVESCLLDCSTSNCPAMFACSSNVCILGSSGMTVISVNPKGSINSPPNPPKDTTTTIPTTSEIATTTIPIATTIFAATSDSATNYSPKSTPTVALTNGAEKIGLSIAALAAVLAF